MNIKDYNLRFILISKTNVKDILETKYLMLTLMQITFYLQILSKELVKFYL
jgi:hypothetical protein